MEREDSDCRDYDCDCVVDWQEGGSLEWICAAGGRGGDKNSLEWISCSFLLMVIFTLCIHKFNIIDGKVRRQLKERFQQQLYKKALQSMLSGGDGWRSGRGSSHLTEVCGCLVE